MAAPVQPNYAELADGLHKIAEQAQHLPNANPAQIFARLDNVQQDQQQILLILHQIMEEQQRSRVQLMELRRDILLAESRSSARGLNSTSGITGVLCFPRTEEGDIPQELALRSPQQLAVLEEHELDAYIQFYRLEGETRVAKLQNLGRFLGCKLL
eukprot:CAMPEP_0177586676 /NCGR_PEP_ID=MMETSP0419_2-20121207/5203_1 /TAXON_ID=582737 /ORGANISM="Tetraselmis sp., Strain GSL018" /LENGTH=155 /DNA_ID=CAMNT_0019076591 /DNA_START=195 /DNA_END=662 /DNA_ORIENTATION=+